MIKGTVNGIWIILKLLWLMLTSWFSSSFASFATLVTICNWNSSTAAICCVHIYLSVEIDHGTLQLFVFTVLILLQLFVFTVSILPLYNISICWTMIPYTTILQWKVFVQQWVAWLLCQPVSQSVSGHKMSTLSELGMFAASCCKGQVTNKKKNHISQTRILWRAVKSKVFCTQSKLSNKTTPWFQYFLLLFTVGPIN